MNINLIYRIENIIKRINADSFDQELISSLIICVRAQLPVNGMAREIGDFIAHPRLAQNIEHAMNFIEDHIEELKK